MTILFDINHPSYAHAFKHVIAQLKEKGHKIFVTATDKDITHVLLKAYSIPFISTGRSPAGNRVKAVFRIFKKVFILLNIIRKNRIELILSFESPYAVLAGWLCRKKTITCADTEAATRIHKITGNLSSAILVPSCFQKKLSLSQVSLKGFKELAYLHPAVFQPDKKIVSENGLNPEEPYCIIRFVAFNALHDKGYSGFSEKHKIKLVRTLSKNLKVYISSEGPLIKELQPYRTFLPPEKMHHALAFASLFIGESPTMAAEAAVLGVPSVCATHMQLGYLEELSETYGLLYKFDLSEAGQEMAVSKALSLADDKNVIGDSKTKRKIMLEDSINVTEFLVWFIENYPGSYEKMNSPSPKASVNRGKPRLPGKF
ncbi:MAG: DUF354 domain-containing protein [Candidatus Atribacteria bacterium]|nr:DUF354 domain-containing protein [Candidatus Atribacteria bacterium]